MEPLLKTKRMPRCLNCREKFIPTFFLQKHCCSPNCKVSEKKLQEEIRSGTTVKTVKPIPKVSDKRKVENLKYLAQRIIFLGKKENQICPITKQPTTDVHHKKGRTGTLYLDENYWVALSREGHKFVEENPIWAKENGYSLNRL